MLGMLEKYFDPFGTKAPLIEEIRELKDALYVLQKKYFDTLRDNYKLKLEFDDLYKELITIQCREIEPFIDSVCQDMAVRSETFISHEIEAQEFRISITTPKVKFMNMGQTKTKYRQEVIDNCSFELSQAIVGYIIKELERNDTHI